MKKALFVLPAALSGILLASAQTVANQGQVNLGAISSLLAQLNVLVARLVPFLLGVAVVAFFWFLIKFIFNGGDPGEKNKALHGMGYSVLALFLMVSIWGIIGFFGSLTGIGAGGSIPVPSVPVAQ